MGRRTDQGIRSRIIVDDSQRDFDLTIFQRATVHRLELSELKWGLFAANPGGNHTTRIQLKDRNDSMTRSLQGQVSVVVGASSGMGRATVRALVASGARVMAAARRVEPLKQLQDEFPDVVQSCQTDVTSREQVQHLIAATIKCWGRIDLLVYATGTNLPSRSLRQLTSSGWDELLATNLTGAFHCTQEVLPCLREQGGGLIIYLSTGAVQRPDVSGVAYQASKHGLTGLAHGTRLEERENGIRTSIIFPGLCDTEILLKRPVVTPPEVLSKALCPEDVAAAVLFLAQLPPRAVVPEMQLLPSQL